MFAAVFSDEGSYDRRSARGEPSPACVAAGASPAPQSSTLPVGSFVGDSKGYQVGLSGIRRSPVSQTVAHSTYEFLEAFLPWQV
jgi:hypothetical protein